MANSVLKGGEFLITESEAQNIYTKEDLTEEQRMFGQMTKEFVEKRVQPLVPNIDKMEKGDSGSLLVVELLEEAGELGLLGATLPEKYGGMGVSFNAGTILSEEIGQSHSFGVSVAAHTGIGTLPILYYGTEEHKKEYLPKLATGEMKASYCLTEPGSGSDALAAKTKAVLSEDQKTYTITGQKMWITNAGFADLFIVFAQVAKDERRPGEFGFTGFVVDAKSANINLGAEEEKMGIKGSSTRQVFFEGVEVPATSVLGEIGKGHYIAFNVLNIGRYKLCAMAMGGCKRAADLAVKYANEREQFGQAIANFGAIKHKLAEMACKSYACDAATYRTSGLIHEMIQGLQADGKEGWEAKIIAAEEYSIECAILKVYGSEACDQVVDELVQVHGGNGFSEEFPAARAYRDSRINRIFEGTNEINRLLIMDMLVKKAMRGTLDIMGPAMAVQSELMSIPDFGAAESEELFAKEKKALKNCKKAVLMAAGAAFQKFGRKLEGEQEILMNLSDMLIEIFVSESTLLKTEKYTTKHGDEAAALRKDLSLTFIAESIDRINLYGKRAILGFAEGDEAKMMMMGLKRFTKYEMTNTIAARRRIADAMIAADSYCFD